MVTPEHHVALVDHLVESSQPVQRLWPVRARVGMLLAAGTAGVAGVALTWPRPDLAAKLGETTLVVELMAMAIATGFTTLMALRCAVPGRAPSWSEAVTTFGLVVAAALTFAADTDPIPAPAYGWLCGLRTVVVALIPWAVLLIAIRRGAPVHMTTAAGYAATAALLFSITLLRTSCPLDGAQHWLVWHFTVVSFGAMLAIPLGKRWLQRWRHG